MSDPDFICDFCSRPFTRKYNLQTHIENCHMNMSWHCAICDAEFGSPAGLDLHLSRGHNSSNQGFPECDLCGRVFSRRQNIMNHMINVHLQTNPVFPCHLCDKNFTTERNMKRHINVLHSHGEKGIFKCELCLKVYMSNQSLRRHTKTVHLSDSKKYTCEYCHKTINSQDSRESHNAFCQKRLCLGPFESQCDYSCGFCEKQFNKEHLLREHIKTTHTFQDFHDYCNKSLIKLMGKQEKNTKMNETCLLYSCEYCIKAYPTVYELKDHMRYTHNKEYSLKHCNVCFQKFFSTEAIKEHRKTCLPPKNVNSCNHCDKFFTEVSSLQFHTRIFHPQAQIPVSITSTSEEVSESYHKYEKSFKHHLKLKHTTDDPLKSNLCEKNSNNKYLLASHLKVVHNNKSSSKCDYCDKEFNSKRYIKSHIEHTHLGMQRYKCVECESLFKDKRSLRKHLRVKHPNSTAFPQCHICGKRFASTKSCKTHIKLLHSLNMNTYPCDVCPVSFDSLDSLNIHLSTKHLAEDKIYKCQGCNIVFKGQEQFSRHLEVFHSNLRSVSVPHCVICIKDFSTRKTLRRHIKKFHIDFNVDELATYGSKRRGFNIDCRDCLKNFTDDSYFAIYLKLKHSRDSIIFKCDTCKSSYNSLEFAIQRQKHGFDASQTKLYLSELCTTEMSEDSKVDSVETMEPESTTNDIKVESCTTEMSDDSKVDSFETMEPESTTNDIKVESCTTEMSDDSKVDSFEPIEAESTANDIKVESCTTEMSDDSKVDSFETMEPESTTNDIKVEADESSDDSLAGDVKVEGCDEIDIIDEFSLKYVHKF